MSYFMTWRRTVRQGRQQKAVTPLLRDAGTGWKKYTEKTEKGCANEPRKCLEGLGTRNF